MSGYVGTASPVYPGEARLMSMTIPTWAIGGGDTIVSAVGSLSLAEGVSDPNAASLVLEPALVSNSVVSQMLGIAWVPGATYRWTLTLTTAEGQTPTFWAYIPAQAVV